MKGKIFLTSGLFIILLLAAGCQNQAVNPSPSPAPAGQQEPAANTETGRRAQLEEELTQTKQDLVLSKFSLEAMNLWKVDQVYKNPLNSDQIIFLRGGDLDNSDFQVGVYDSKKDTGYEKTGNVDILTSAFIYNEKLKKSTETGIYEPVIYAAGMDGSKLVLWETGSDNSPGPCFSTWQADNLTFIDIQDPKPVRKPYKLSESKMKEAEKEVADCQKEMGL